MKKLVYEVGTKKTCSYAEALEYAKALGEIVKTLFEEVEEPVHMTDKQRAIRPRVQLLERCKYGNNYCVACVYWVYSFDRTPFIFNIKRNR